MYDELVKALRHKYEDMSMMDECKNCKYRYHESCNIWTLMDDAADAIERLQKQNEELQARWDGAEICGYNAQYLIMFADACKRQHVTNDDLKRVADDLTWAVQTVYDAAKRAMENVAFKMTDNGCEASMKYIFPPPVNPDRLKQMDFKWDISGCKSVKLSDIKYKEMQSDDTERPN